MVWGVVSKGLLPGLGTGSGSGVGPVSDAKCKIQQTNYALRKYLKAFRFLKRIIIIYIYLTRLSMGGATLELR